MSVNHNSLLATIAKGFDVPRLDNAKCFLAVAGTRTTDVSA
jgi:hypothetical protein